MKKLILAVVSAALVPGAGSAQDVEAGRKEFAALCAGCHGVDGGGGEYGPNIVDMRRFGPRWARDVADVIKDGIEDSGMPAFPLPQAQIDSLAAFVHSLRAPAAEHPAPGNASAGERYFFGSGGCSNCHMVNGRGGNLGPDLSNIGGQRRLGQITQALRNPGANTTPGYRLVSIRMRDGSAVRGLVKNESNFDLQLQTLDGGLRLLEREQIAEETRETAPLMPPAKGTDEELRDVVAYLSRLAKDNSAPLEGAASSGNGAAFAAIADPKPGEWPTYNGNLSGNRYSPLRDINTENVAHLAPKWMFPIANSRRLEVTPVVVDGVMFVTTANEVYALDARSGRQIWHYARPLTKGVIGDAASAINRGVAVLGERLFLATDNAHLIALDRTTGHLLWDAEIADYRKGYGATSAPLVVNDLVLTGTSGGDEGARGFVAAFNAATGKRVWQFWTMPAPGEPGSETWVGRAIEHGCVTGWLTGTYDPELNLTYWGTGNPHPVEAGQAREGANLYTCTIVALNADTGKLVWYFQPTPHDTHDWDAVQTPVLFDGEFEGKPRKMLAQASRSGMFFLLDRTNGQSLLHSSYVKTDWVAGYDEKGQPIPRKETEPAPNGALAFPAAVGGTNYMAPSFDPDTGLFFVNGWESEGIFYVTMMGKTAEGWGGRDFLLLSTPYLKAIDYRTGKVRWERNMSGGEKSGWPNILTTAGHLLFTADSAGQVLALDPATGKVLWRTYTGGTATMAPMTYELDGKQYVITPADGVVYAWTLPAR